MIWLFYGGIQYCSDVLFVFGNLVRSFQGIDAFLNKIDGISRFGYRELATVAFCLLAAVAIKNCHQGKTATWLRHFYVQRLKPCVKALGVMP